MVDLSSTVPSSLARNARWVRLGSTAIPAMLVRAATGSPPWPTLIWMHGRTASKELDPGRYLRLMRSGIAVCAVDLPGHGERRDERLLAGDQTLQVVLTMEQEIDDLLVALREDGDFDSGRLALGGMSAGGMAALRRLCHPHPFTCACVEATTGSWEHQARRPMFRDLEPAELHRLSPMSQIDGWREIPLQIIHARQDEWMAFEGQQAFAEALRGRYGDPSGIEVVAFEHTGAPHEHIGFGRLAAEAKDHQRDFLRRRLLGAVSGAGNTDTSPGRSC